MPLAAAPTAGMPPAATVALLLLLLLLWLLRPHRGWRPRPPLTPGDSLATMVVFGSGGHTAEMLGLLRALPPRYAPLTYVAAESDTTSEPRAKAARAIPPEAQLLRIPRSREVGQSFVRAVLPTLRALRATLRLLRAARPRVLLVNGPGTCIPVCAAALWLNALGVTDTRIVFVESVCRVTSLSLSGRLLYWVADQVQVQWPELKARCVACAAAGVHSARAAGARVLRRRALGRSGGKRLGFGRWAPGTRVVTRRRSRTVTPITHATHIRAQPP